MSRMSPPPPPAPLWMPRRVFVFDLDETLMPTHALFSPPRSHQLLASMPPLEHDGGASMRRAYQYIVRPDPHLSQMLGALRGPKYLFTNGSRQHGLGSLQALGVLDHFDGQLDRDSAGGMLKPNPRVFALMHAVVQRESPGAEIVFFDDQLANLQQAKAFGWRTVWIDASAGIGLQPAPAPAVDLRARTVYEGLRPFLN